MIKIFIKNMETGRVILDRDDIGKVLLALNSGDEISFVEESSIDAEFEKLPKDMKVLGTTPLYATILTEMFKRMPSVVALTIIKTAQEMVRGIQSGEGYAKA